MYMLREYYGRNNIVMVMITFNKIHDSKSAFPRLETFAIYFFNHALQACASLWDAVPIFKDMTSSVFKENDRWRRR